MQDAVAELQHFRKDTAFLEAHREDLVRQHPDRWIAIFGEEVVGVAPSLEELLDDLEKKGIPVGQVLVECFTSSPEVYILPG